MSRIDRLVNKTRNEKNVFLDMAVDIMFFFSTSEKPVSLGEARKFWESLNPEDQFYYMNSILKTLAKLA